jgi:peptide/nickel transport system substrate-binding protein
VHGLARWLFPLIVLTSACRDAATLPEPLAAAGLPGPRRGGTLRFALTDDVRTLDPAVGFDEFSMGAEHLLFDGLLTYRPASSGHARELGPGLPESWTESKDGRAYTFTLRPDIVYENGRRIVAADFANSIERTCSSPSPPGRWITPIPRISWR